MNRWSFPVAALLTLVLSSPALAQTCQTYSGLTYGTYVDSSGATQALQLELLVPQGVSGPAPVILWIHGGGWRTGSRLPVPTRASNLCSRGYAVASVDYRLTTTALWPAQIQDVRGAVRWLRAHASDYNLDVDRFGAWGESAGGHLAAFLAFSGGAGTVTVGSVTLDLEGSTGGNLDQSSRVQAVVDWYGATDVLQMHFYPTTVNHDSSASDESKFLGGPIQDRPELAATANPIPYIDEDDPPLLAMHGTLDKLIPSNQSQLLVDAVRAAGVSARLVPVQGAGHGGSAFDKTANLQIVYDYFDSTLRSGTPSAGDPTTHPSVTPGQVTLTATDRFASESGADGGRITFTRSGGTAFPLTVAYSVSGTATPGDDYAALSGSVTIPSGQASADVDVTPLDDNLYETGETVILAVDSSSASVVIRDVEPVRPVVAVSLSDQDAAEPSDPGEFIVWRTGSTTNPLTVDLIHGGTASGSDYDLPTTATIPAGSDRVLLKVTPASDALVEDPETVTLSVAAGPAIYPGPYAGSTVTIADGPPLALSSFTLTPATFTGGCKTSTGKVTLTAKAGAGGVVVSLSNTNPVAVVPSSVTVPSGSTSATFLITAPAVTSSQAGTITASYAGKSLSNTVTVKPIGLTSLALSPNPVVGPASVTGTVTLDCPAAPGSITVALSSSSTGVASPTTPSLIIPAGSTQGTFTVTTADVSTQSFATIKTVAGGTTKSVKLTVNP
ncbi:MAG TPA: alpha/beta hydrolase fold domain-containing protein [Thermoanaerobaculia bacterium]|jgi:acetyl esterase/lipase|nr:alpha/beta hydrolase fold domain-containing protein [Thermoanaerobaculia bacterium]